MIFTAIARRLRTLWHNACGTCADNCSWNTDVVGRNTTTADEGDDKAYCGTDNGKSTGHLVHLKYAEL